MRVGSLFSGVGGLDLGLERAGMRVSWQVENDSYASKILKRHWPNVARFEDVRAVGAHNLEPVDLICGGFPCQDISLAGRRQGIKGKRSRLWKQFARIVEEMRPSFVLVENVTALRGRGLSVVLCDLAARGYDAEWDCIPASAVGSAQQRDRLFVVAYASGKQNNLSSSSWAHIPSSPVSGRSWSTPQSRPWAFESGFCGATYGFPGRVDRLRCLGNAVVPQVAEHIGRMIMSSV